MKTKLTLYLLLFIISFKSADAQQWDTVASFNSYINALQTFDNKLFIGGDFMKMDGLDSYRSAYYDGVTFTPHATNIQGTGIDDFAVFNNELYSAGGLVYVPVGSGLSMWDGSTWQYANSIENIDHNDLYADGNDLYATTSSGNIYKKTGAGPFVMFLNSGAGVNSIIRYQSNLIITGQFTSIMGVPANNIAKWNGTSWSALGSGLSSQGREMEVYNNDLYVCGGFNTAGGVNAKCIAKWNGSTWSDVGGSVSGVSLNGIRDLKKTATGLVAVGQFDQIGGVNTSNAAKWNGSTWTSMSLVHNEPMLSCVEEYNGSIYAGAFDVTLQSKNRLYKFGAAAASVQDEEIAKVSICPNPVINTVLVSWAEDNIETVSLFSVTGQVLMNETVKNMKSLKLELGNIPCGMYLLELKSSKGQTVKKIFKQ